jgi:hypothetical protein
MPQRSIELLVDEAVQAAFRQASAVILTAFLFSNNW